MHRYLAAVLDPRVSHEFADTAHLAAAGQGDIGNPRGNMLHHAEEALLVSATFWHEARADFCAARAVPLRDLCASMLHTLELCRSSEARAFDAACVQISLAAPDRIFAPVALPGFPRFRFRVALIVELVAGAGREVRACCQGTYFVAADRACRRMLLSTAEPPCLYLVLRAFDAELRRRDLSLLAYQDEVRRILSLLAGLRGPSLSDRQQPQLCAGEL